MKITTKPVELELLESKILSLLNTATEHERNKAAIELGHLSARLAHDIHSPLAAMEIGLGFLNKKIPSHELDILINGIQSIRDIANNVLERYRNPNPENNSLKFTELSHNGNLVCPILLFNLIEMVISQKRHEWYQQQCDLIFTTTPEAKICWISAAPNEVKRLLSNLLNNAYDALIDKSQGVIHLSLKVIDKELHLSLHDNGIGIPSEKINDVLNGISFKHSGTGLGLSGAKKSMENLGGKLEINSSVMQGTKINLIFPFIENFIEPIPPTVLPPLSPID